MILLVLWLELNGRFSMALMCSCLVGWLTVTGWFSPEIFCYLCFSISWRWTSLVFSDKSQSVAGTWFWLITQLEWLTRCLHIVSPYDLDPNSMLARFESWWPSKLASPKAGCGNCKHLRIMPRIITTLLLSCHITGKISQVPVQIQWVRETYKIICHVR